MAKRQRDPERERFWRRTFSAWQASGQSIRVAHSMLCRRRPSTIGGGNSVSGMHKSRRGAHRRRSYRCG
jgi:hypothetical protein